MCVGRDDHVIKKFGKKQSVVATFGDGSYTVETLSEDPKNKLFLGFRLVSTNGKELVRFRAPKQKACSARKEKMK